MLQCCSLLQEHLNWLREGRVEGAGGAGMQTCEDRGRDGERECSSL